LAKHRLLYPKALYTLPEREIEREMLQDHKKHSHTELPTSEEGRNISGWASLPSFLKSSKTYHTNQFPSSLESDSSLTILKGGQVMGGSFESKTKESTCEDPPTMPLREKESLLPIRHDSEPARSKTNPEHGAGRIKIIFSQQAKECMDNAINVSAQVQVLPVATANSTNKRTKAKESTSFRTGTGVVKVIDKVGDARVDESSGLIGQQPKAGGSGGAAQLQTRKIDRRQAAENQAAIEEKRRQEFQADFPTPSSPMPPTREHANAVSQGSASQHATRDERRNNGNHVQQPINQPINNAAQARRGQHLNSLSGASSTMGSPPGNRMEENEGSRMIQPAPLFERLVTEEVQELKAYARIIENQNRRLAELERVHGDLEARLELGSRGRVQLEGSLEMRERQWAVKFKELEADRDHWKDVVKVEQTKNARLIDQVVRKDQDIHRMLQRKVRLSLAYSLLDIAMYRIHSTCPATFLHLLYSMTINGILLPNLTP
jgi:hypothetical protein